MYGAKKKSIGGREYMVIGSTVEREGFRVVFFSRIGLSNDNTFS